jgi:hypothetical protein
MRTGGHGRAIDLYCFATGVRFYLFDFATRESGTGVSTKFPTRRVCVMTSLRSSGNQPLPFQNVPLSFRNSLSVAFFPCEIHARLHLPLLLHRPRQLANACCRPLLCTRPRQLVADASPYSKLRAKMRKRGVRIQKWDGEQHRSYEAIDLGCERKRQAVRLPLRLSMLLEYDWRARIPFCGVLPGG